MIRIMNTVKILGSILKNISYFKWIWRPMLTYCENNVENLDYNGFDYINNFFYNYYYDSSIPLARKHNIRYLKNRLSYPVNDNLDDTYFCYVINCGDEKRRDALLKYLVSKGVYCPVYWPLEFDTDGSCNHHINETVLMIPIDQRYDEESMRYVVDHINAFNACFRPSRNKL